MCGGGESVISWPARRSPRQSSGGCGLYSVNILAAVVGLARQNGGGYIWRRLKGALAIGEICAKKCGNIPGVKSASACHGGGGESGEIIAHRHRRRRLA